MLTLHKDLHVKPYPERHIKVYADSRSGATPAPTAPTPKRQQTFAAWLDFYNHQRPHTALDGLTPMATLINNLHGKHT